VDAAGGAVVEERQAVGRPPTAEELAYLDGHRVARLATVDGRGAPSLVPICFARIDLGGEPIVVSALDDKPKRVDGRDLARVRNIAANPTVALLVDDYVEEWSELAFVRFRGEARLIEPGEAGHAEAVATLREKYAQYGVMPIHGRPVVAIGALRAFSWSGAGPAATLGGTAPSRPGMEALAATIRGRRSVRAFDPRPVPRPLVEAAIEAAGWAPSPHGRQPWRFAVVEAAARRASLAEAMAATWRTQLDLDGQDAATVERRLARSRERLTTAPLLIVPCLYLEDLDVYPDPARQDAERTMAIQSLGAAVQNLLLSLYASRLDAGWMCAPLFCPDVVRRELGLAETLDPQALIAVGYAAKDPVRRPRLPVAELIVGWE